jgi:hypothetical protein
VKYQSPFGVIGVFLEVAINEVSDAAMDYANTLDAATQKENQRTIGYTVKEDKCL